MRSRRTQIMSLVLTAGFVAACGSSGSSSTDSGSASSGPAAVKATGTPIKVGYIRTQSGGLPGFISVGDQIQAGMEGYIGWLNDHGGINGRPLQLLNGDDASDPNTGLAAAKRLVEQEGILTMLTVSGASLTAVSPYLEQQKVPMSGTLAPVLATFKPPHPYIFGTQTPYEYQGAAVAEYLKKSGKLKVAYAGYNTLSGKQFGKGFVDRFTELGGTIVVQDAFAQPSSDFTALVGKLRDANPDAVVWFSSDAEAAAVLKQAQNVGFSPTWIWGPGATTPHLTTLVGPLAEGTLGVSPFAALTASSPAVTQLKDNVAKYSTVKASASSYTEFGYLDAEAAADAMKAVTGPLTTASIRDALEGLSGDYGLMPAFHLSPTNHLMDTSVQILKLAGNDLQAASDFISPQLPASIGS